jgi:Fe-S cluster biogenesis protein NfuA
MLLHGLHPEGLARRVERALEGVRPLLGSHGGDVELLDVDEAVGAVHLRLLGSCDGCPSSASTLQGAVEAAVIAAAPEVVLIEVLEPSATAPPMREEDGSVTISIGRKPVYEACPSELVSTT